MKKKFLVIIGLLLFSCLGFAKEKTYYTGMNFEWFLLNTWIHVAEHHLSSSENNMPVITEIKPETSDLFKIVISQTIIIDEDFAYWITPRQTVLYARIGDKITVDGYNSKLIRGDYNYFVLDIPDEE